MTKTIDGTINTKIENLKNLEPGMVSEEGATFYSIEYYNNVFKENYSIKINDFTEASNKAKTIKGLVEMKNVKLYEVKEIDFN